VYTGSPIRHSIVDQEVSVHDVKNYHLSEKYQITVDPCSDSGFVKSSRFSVSDQDLEFL